MNLALQSLCNAPAEAPSMCTHDELLTLDQTLSYTAIANDIMLHILSKPTIASAVKLWLFIRVKQSGFRDRHHIAFSIKQLSTALGVGRSTIQNWQRTLEREGYLEIITRKSGMKSNLSNLYRACLPSQVHQEIQQGSNQRRMDSIEPRKDKVKKSREQRTGDSIEKPRISTRTQVEDIERTREVYGRSFYSPSKKGPGTSYTQNQRPITPPEKNRIKILLREQSIPTWLALLFDGISINITDDGTMVLWDTPDHAKSALVKVFALCTKEMQQRLYGFNGTCRFESTALNHGNAPLPEKKKNCSKTKQSHHLKVAPITANPAPQPISQSGATELSKHTRRRVVSRLQTFTNADRPLFSPNQIQTLVGEISYAVTHGALSKFNPNHGINIALKLIKENRWHRPKGYVQGGTIDQARGAQNIEG